jgi:anti-sigma B factor antagonist
MANLRIHWQSLREDDMAGLHVQPGPDGVLFLSGELDMETAAELQGEALSYVDGQPEVVLDLSELTFIDSTGIRALLRLADVKAPARLVLRHPRSNVSEVLRIVRIESLGIKVEP